MRISALLTGTHLAAWADQLEARSQLPRLVRRLIHAVAATIDWIDFPAGEGVGKPGCDGVLRASGPNAFVPSGLSIWEMGVDKDPRAKANDDYKKRKQSPPAVDPQETTFVFVTPRRWAGKTAWLQEKRAENYWADVRAYDADDIEQWLEQASAVAAWACRLIHSLPPGLRDIDEIWDQWTSRTAPPLRPELPLAGRSAVEERIQTWLDGPAAILSIRGDSVDEVLAVTAATIERLDETRRETIKSRFVYVENSDAWRGVAGQRVPLILAANISTATAAPQAVKQGHHVLIASGADASGSRADLTLDRLRRADLESALQVMGIDETRARELARESQGRVAALVDLLENNAPSAPPRWAQPDVAPTLIPFLLCGSWIENETDRQVVRQLAGRANDEDLDHVLTRWANEVDSPWLRVGNVWKWVSRRRGWRYLSGFMSPRLWTSFREAIALVIGEFDPRVDLPAEDRWAAAVHDQLPRYSSELRAGLAEGLALMAAAAPTEQPEIEAIVYELYGPTPDPRRWYSLASVLKPLAEAAPDAFLAAVERHVLGSPEVLAQLFQDEGPWGSSRHTELLWALEALSWSPDHFSQVVLILARLAARDPGGRTANRPSASLRSIFLPWHPYTNTSIDKRGAAIDLIAQYEPQVAFDLCLGLLPRVADIAIPIATPNWREWPSQSQRAADESRTKAQTEALNRLLVWSGIDSQRWARLVSHILELSFEEATQVVQGLEQALSGNLASTEELRNAIRKVLSRLTQLMGTESDPAKSMKSRLERILDQLKPTDPIARHAWLFTHRPKLPEKIRGDWKANNAAIDAERQSAIEDIFQPCGLEGLLRLVEAVEVSQSVGYAIAQAEFNAHQHAELLETWLDGDQRSLDAAYGLISGSWHSRGRPWLDQIFAETTAASWCDERRVRFALSLTPQSETWDFVEGWGEVAAGTYWARIRPYYHGNIEDVPRATRTLINRGRPNAALQLLTFQLRIKNDEPNLEVELIAEALRAASDPNALDASYRSNAEWCHLPDLLDVVERSQLVSVANLSAFEWIWFPHLERSELGFRFVHQHLSQDPRFFVFLISLCYHPCRSSAESADSDDMCQLENRQKFALRACRALKDWRRVPGSQTDGSIDSDALQAWVAAARQACLEADRAEVGDDHIGQILATAPTGADGIWPHEAVREVIESPMGLSFGQGFHNGVMNSRGVTWRSMDEGGRSERELAESYRADAGRLASRWPRTAAFLRDIAETYQAYGRQEDDRRDQREFD